MRMIQASPILPFSHSKIILRIRVLTLGIVAMLRVAPMDMVEDATIEIIEGVVTVICATISNAITLPTIKRLLIILEERTQVYA